MKIPNYYEIRKKVFDRLAWFLSKNELHHGIENVSGSVELIHEFTEKYVGHGYYASLHSHQVRSEIIALGKLIQDFHPRRILEIGTKKGGTLFLWSRSNIDASLIMSVDLPGGLFGGGYTTERRKLYKEFIYDRPDSIMHLLQANSHDESTYMKVQEILNNNFLDFIFIDGDHTYEGVKQDFLMYSKLVKNGIIAFHDIAHHSEDCGVDQLWSELKLTYKTQEFIETNSNKGIGVVFL